MKIACIHSVDNGSANSTECALGLGGGNPGRAFCRRCDHCDAGCREAIMTQMPTVESKPITIGKVRSYFVAEWSMYRHGPVADAVTSDRCAHCMVCDANLEPEPGGLGYCDDCGCGKRARARLAIKTKMPKTSCPRGHWDESKGIGRRHLDHADRIAIRDVIGAFVNRSRRRKTSLDRATGTGDDGIKQK